MTRERRTIKQLEAEIYSQYYQNNPNGDARWVLWPDVLDAKEQRNKKKALLKILKYIKNYY